MIDIHCHILFGVDDGATDIQESVKMLQEAAKQGIQAIIVTPHYRHGMFAYPKDKIDSHFMQLHPFARKLGIEIYPGCEYHVNSNITEAFRQGRCHTLGDKRYVLTEYSGSSEYSYICSMTRELLRSGYTPIIAHVERYLCMAEQPDHAEELQNMGAWIQINADAVLGNDGHRVKKYCKQLLKNEWVDVIASDAHGIDKRACHMAECYKYVCRKYGVDYAEHLMQENPALILK